VRSKIVLANIVHHRQFPIPYQFEYPLYMLAVDLEDLEELDRMGGMLFGVSRRALFSLHRKDYLYPGNNSIKKALYDFFADKPPFASVKKVVLVTLGRFMGKGFIPVSFFFCYEAKNVLIGVLAEVHNTFKEKHLYLLRELEQDSKTGLFRFSTKKAFYVSPMFDLNGYYDFEVKDINDELRAGLEKLDSVLSGKLP